MESDQPNNLKVIINSLLWGFLLPQVFLLISNIYSWQLINGEVNQEETKLALTIFTAEVALFLSVLLSAVLLYLRKMSLNWRYITASLIAHVSYMWFFVTSLHSVIPNSIQPWILSEGNVGRWTITLIMPAAFISLYALSKVAFSSVKESTSRLIVLGLSLGMPVLWYVFVSAMQPAWFGQISIVISIIISTITVIVFLAAIIRLFDNIIHKKISGNFIEKHYVLAVLLGLAAPLGGLTLNKSIPFPTDFQATIIYVLTVINGLILLIKPNESKLSPIKLFLRFLSLPFIAYSFLVFLPFLPLSLLAIIAMGAGFLMLTPLVLGLFQARITYQEFCNSINRIGKSQTLIISLLGFSIIPGYLLTQAFLDKRALDSSLEYFYSHDYAERDINTGDLERASNALVQLRDRKSDIQMPYISGAYNYIVFGSLVLPDTKITKMYELLNGEKMPETKNSFFGDRGRSGRSFRGFGITPPKREVSLEGYSVEEVNDTQKTLYLSFRNNTDDTHSLYVEKISLPEGVFVTGLRLKIKGEWVDGKLFDRKTALWVFQKITEVRRDPALLHYLSNNLLELRVYPFPNNGIREVEIDFETHPSMDSVISIGDEKIDINNASNNFSAVNIQGESLHLKDVSSLEIKRTPYLHFILDYSKGSSFISEDYANEIIKVAKKLEIDKVKVTAANISSSTGYSGALLSITDKGSIIDAVNGISLKRQGGLWVEQAIVKEFFRYRDTLNDENFKTVPVFVVLSHKQMTGNSKVELSNWSWLIPDMQGWYYSEKSQLSYQRMNTRTNKVLALKINDEINIISSVDSGLIEAAENIKVFSNTTESFNPLETETIQSTQLENWARYAKIWLNIKEARLNPATFESEKQNMHKESVKEGLLLPSTAYIVVESASQWEILKRKEKQSLKNNSGLEFENEEQTSEPAAWLLLIMLLVFIYCRDRKDSRNSSI